MKTYSANLESIENSWYLIDANNKTLGRLASSIAFRLRGKHKATYTPHVDTGDFIVVVNAEKIRVTGNKMANKIYNRNTSNKPGELKSVNLEKLMAQHPTRALENAVKGMLPKGPLGRKMFKKLKVYAGAEHPHSAQTPKPLEIKER